MNSKSKIVFDFLFHVSYACVHNWLKTQMNTVNWS